MICKVYISSARLMLQDREISSIVKASQVNNKELGITGILLYNSGNFMQLIEGEAPNVDALYKKINQDKRHRDMTLLLTENITHRNFEHWLMGYRDLDSIKNIDRNILSPFLDDDLNFSIYKNNPYRALEFLEIFKKIQG